MLNKFGEMLANVGNVARFFLGGCRAFHAQENASPATELAVILCLKSKITS